MSYIVHIGTGYKIALNYYMSTKHQNLPSDSVNIGKKYIFKLSNIFEEKDKSIVGKGGKIPSVGVWRLYGRS